MTSPLVILQARTGSQRLPGKALLDFHGLPLSVLAARRAGNRGARVIVATSHDPSDDALAATLLSHGIDTARGSLVDVLGRFVHALGDMPDAAPVVRLTGDNILPDGTLIADVLSVFERRGLDYITTTHQASGLPYGCAVEITRAGHLRRAAAEARTAHEREHVTPAIRARFGVEVFTDHAAQDAGRLRSTIDCLDDYQALHRTIPAETKLTDLPWQDWVERLRDAVDAPHGSRPVRDMVLGTAQLGMSYGIARRGGPDKSESLGMLRRAIVEGVEHLDTARAYGESEALIGALHAQGWGGRARVITKLSPLEELHSDATPGEAAACAEVSLLRSCLALRNDRLDCVLLHRVAHLDAWHGAVFETLLRWQSDGQIGTLGVSVQSPVELRTALECSAVGHVQLPCNILDHRWDDLVDAIREARQERGLVVHVRSALLQGLIGTEDPELWQRAHVAEAATVISWLSRKAELLGRESKVALALAWARGLDWADGVVVGCDGLDQLNDTIRLFNQPAFTREEIALLVADRPVLEPHSLDPAQWVTKRQGREIA
jgi:spore coat polysaccharide biosynthesis protein SpsF (cytidylyltransferase family)/aryl-alcohol dehydrogenase-like predicted oxidoreductase